MHYEPLPPRAERPDWRRPQLLAVAASILSLLLGLVGLLPEVGKLPVVVRGVLVLVPIAVAIMWAGSRGVTELKVAWQRLRSHDRVYARMECEKARADREELRADRERVRVEALSMQLTAALAHPGRFRRAVFAMSSPRLEDDQVVMVMRPLDPREALAPRAGERLVIVDPEDGKWQGEVEVLAHRSLSGERLARVTDYDSVWFGFVEQKAVAREPYLLNAVAIYVTAQEGATDG